MPSDRERRLLKCLRQHEKGNTVFTFADLATDTDYAQPSISAYYSKKLKNYLVFPVKKGHFRCEGLTDLTDEQYFDHMSQKSSATHEAMQPPLARRLIDRAFASLTLALEVYNRPTQSNRVEAFTILVINAWELLLKAELVEEKGEDSVYYKKSNPNRSLSLRDVLKTLMAENDPVRINLERVEAIRDDAMHLLIPELHTHFGRLFQSSVLNFVERAKERTGRHPLEDEGPGLLTLVMDGPPLDPALVKREYGATTAERVKAFVVDFEAEEQRLKDTAFAVKLEYKLVLTKKSEDADISIATSPQGRSAVVIHQPKDIDKMYPLKARDVRNRLADELKDPKLINSHSFTAIVFKHDLKNDPQMHYRIELANMSVFSEKIVAFIVKRARHPNWIKEARESYSRHLASIRAERKKNRTKREK